jgi:hypothetical protein
LRKRARRLSQQYTVLEEIRAQGVAFPTDVVKDRNQALAKRLAHTQDYRLLLDHADKQSIFTDADRKILRSLIRKRLKRTHRKAVRLINDTSIEIQSNRAF